MDFKKHLMTAWELTLKFIVSLVLMTLVMAVLAGITLGVLAPVLMAGYMQSILLMIRENREPKIRDLFSEMRLFLPLLGFGFLAMLLILIGFMLFFLPGIVIALGLTYTCLYMLPLMTDKKLGLIDAVKESFDMVTQDQPAEQLVVAILFIAISALGGSVLLGSLFTHPLATIFLLSVYNEKASKSGPPSVETEKDVPKSFAQ